MTFQENAYEEEDMHSSNTGMKNLRKMRSYREHERQIDGKEKAKNTRQRDKQRRMKRDMWENL